MIKKIIFNPSLTVEMVFKLVVFEYNVVNLLKTHPVYILYVRIVPQDIYLFNSSSWYQLNHAKSKIQNIV